MPASLACLDTHVSGSKSLDVMRKENPDLRSDAMTKAKAPKFTAFTQNCSSIDTFPSTMRASQIRLVSAGKERRAWRARRIAPASPARCAVATNIVRLARAIKHAYCVSAENGKRSSARTTHSTAPALEAAELDPPSRIKSSMASQPSRCSSSHSGNASMSRTRDATSRRPFSSATRARAARSGDTPATNGVG